mgnify:CR=1 FL=1
MCSSDLLGVAATGWPLATGQSRTPGWTAFPDDWQQASAYLDAGTRDGDDGAVWVVPGSGFGIQTWGWTMEEPLQVLGDTPWLTRSQVPLTPAATIRMLSTLEAYLETGTGSPFLATTLRRIGVDRILLRHDLAPAAQSIDPGLVARALARSPGIERATTFGRVGLGPAIEIFDVDGGTDGFRARPAAEVVTIASSVEDVVTALGAGLLADDRPAQVPGGEGVAADAPASVLGDGFRRRERNFGRVHDATSNVMTPDDPTRSERTVPDYPGPSGAEPVTARYPGLTSVEATSSDAYADVLGPIRPETAPWSALDGDPSTYWLSAPYLDAVGQGIRIGFAEPQRPGRIVLSQPVEVLGLQVVRSWRIEADGVDRTVTADPVTGRAVLDLGASGGTGAAGIRSLRITAVDVPDPGQQIGLAEVRLDGLDLDAGSGAGAGAGAASRPGRTLVVPPVPLQIGRAHV